MDQIYLPIDDIEKETRLLVTLMTEQVGITKGTPIAIGEADLASMKIFTEADAKGEYKTTGTIELTDPNGANPNSHILIKLKFTPKAPDAGPSKEAPADDQAEEVPPEEVLDEVVNE